MTTISTIRHPQKKDVLGTYKMMKTDFEVIQVFEATKLNSFSVKCVIRSHASWSVRLTCTQ